mgnify:FL=1
MSAGTIVVTVCLITAIGIATWYFVVSYKYGKTLSNFSYTRGANLDTLDKNKGSVNMTCESGAEICVWKANAICSGPLKGSVSNTEGGPEPISNGLNSNSAYGDFDIHNTIDLTTDMSTQANGKQLYSYNFDVTNKNFGGKTCPMNYDVKSGTGSRPQLIATYTCIPKGTKCQSSKPPTPPTPPTPPEKFTQVNTLSGIVNVTTNNNNQICGSTNQKTFKVQCIDNYTTNPQSYTVPGYLTQLSLSDTGSVMGVGTSSNVYYLNNFKTDNSWNNITNTVGANRSITNRFGKSGTVGGNTAVDTFTWTMPKGGSPNKLAVYGWSTIDSNAKGDIAGIAYGNIQYLPNGISPSVPVPAQFNPTNISINSSGAVCATTDKGSIMCTSSYSSPLWTTVSTGQNFTSLSINDNNTICASKNDGTVWCTA